MNKGGIYFKTKCLSAVVPPSYSLESVTPEADMSILPTWTEMTEPTDSDHRCIRLWLPDAL